MVVVQLCVRELSLLRVWPYLCLFSYIYIQKKLFELICLTWDPTFCDVTFACTRWDAKMIRCAALIFTMIPIHQHADDGNSPQWMNELLAFIVIRDKTFYRPIPTWHSDSTWNTLAVSIGIIVPLMESFILSHSEKGCPIVSRNLGQVSFIMRPVWCLVVLHFQLMDVAASHIIRIP